MTSKSWPAVMQPVRPFEEIVATGAGTTRSAATPSESQRTFMIRLCSNRAATPEPRRGNHLENQCRVVEMSLEIHAVFTPGCDLATQALATDWRRE